MTNKRSEPSDATSFFDSYATEYARRAYNRDARPDDWDLDFLEFIKKNPSNKTLLDVGAGAGRFASLVKMNLPDMQVTALDPSVTLLSMIEDPSISKVVGKIPDLNLCPGEAFSFIHVSNVLHHLVGETVNESRNTARDSLSPLRDHLDDSGFLMILEELWETHVIPTATRTLAFFLLSVARKLNIATPRFLSPVHSQSIKGLVVCIYTASELENILKESGFEIVQFKIHSYPPQNLRQKLWKKLAFLKRWGQMRFIVRKANTPE